MTALRKRPFRKHPHPSRARMATIAAVAARLTRDLGHEPTDEEIARLLATKVKHIARARRASMVVRP